MTLLSEIEELKTLGNFWQFSVWVNKASGWIDGNAICFDANGRRCRMGKDFMRARDENTFPVYFTWDRLQAERMMDTLKGLAEARAREELKGDANGE